MSEILGNIIYFMRKKHLNKKELIERIRKIMGERGVQVLSDKALYAKFDGSRRIEAELIPYIAQALEVTEQDLFDYSKRERIAKEEINKNSKGYLTFLDLQTIEDSAYLPFVCIGSNSESFANIDLLESVYCPKKILPENIDEKNTLLCKIVSDSMEPEFKDGDIVFIELANGREIIFQDGIYLIRYGEVVQIKRVQFFGSDDLKILSFNPDYPPIRPKEEGLDWEIIGKPYFVWKCKEYARLKVKKGL